MQPNHIHDESRHRNRLGNILKRLPEHDLGHSFAGKLIRTTSIGGFSDIFTGFLKDEIFQNSIYSPICLLCRNSKILHSPEYEEPFCIFCRSIWSGRLAVKKFRIHIKNRNHFKDIARELYILSKVSHLNILPFIGYLNVDGYPAIVSPWVERGDLRVLIEQRQLSRSDEILIFMAYGIAEGLKYLHSINILHCDLKSPNIFLSSVNRPLLADFGLSRFVTNDASVAFTMTFGSPASTRWSAPELFDETYFSNATDVWAFGMVLYEIMVHELPYFKQKRDPEIMKKIIMGVQPDWPGEEVESELRLMLRDLCGLCWSMDPGARPDMERICMALFPHADDHSRLPEDKVRNEEESCRLSPTSSTSSHMSIDSGHTEIGTSVKQDLTVPSQCEPADIKPPETMHRQDTFDTDIQVDSSEDQRFNDTDTEPSAPMSKEPIVLRDENPHCYPTVSNSDPELLSSPIISPSERRPRTKVTLGPCQACRQSKSFQVCDGLPPDPCRQCTLLGLVCKYPEVVSHRKKVRFMPYGIPKDQRHSEASPPIFRPKLKIESKESAIRSTDDDNSFPSIFSPRPSSFSGSSKHIVENMPVSSSSGEGRVFTFSDSEGPMPSSLDSQSEEESQAIDAIRQHMLGEDKHKESE